MVRFGVYIATMMAALASGHFGAWQTTDMWVLSRLHTTDPPALSQELVLVDVPYPAEFKRTDNPESFRKELGKLMVRLAEDPETAPRDVILDFYFTKDTRGLDHLASGLAALKKARVNRYAAVRLGDPGSEPEPAYMAEHLQPIYRDYLTNFGHTQFSHFDKLLWYDTSLGADNRPALPVAALDRSLDLRAGLPGRLIVPVGDPREALAVTFCHAAGAECIDGVRPLESKDARDKRVIIGNLTDDRRNPLHRPGPELLAWAISDLSAGGSSRGLVPVTSTGALIGVALALALVSAAAFFFGYRVAIGRFPPAVLRRRMALVAAGALGLGASAWFGLWALLQTHGRSLPPTLPMISIIVLTGLAWNRSLQQVDWELYAGGAESTTVPVAHDVFLSYAHQPDENVEWVRRNIYEPLVAASLTVFFDTSSIRRGRDWKREIDRAIAGSRVFLPVYSDAYFRSPQCIDELAFAEQRRSSGRMTIMPLSRMPMSQAPEIYQKIQAADASRVDMLVREVITHCGANAGGA